MKDLSSIKDVINKITKLAKIEYRDLKGQLTKMTELYEKTYKISADASEPRSAASSETKRKKRAPLKKKRSDLGSTRSDEAKKNIRMGILKSKLKRRAKERKESAL